MALQHQMLLVGAALHTGPYSWPGRYRGIAAPDASGGAGPAHWLAWKIQAGGSSPWHCSTRCFWWGQALLHTAGLVRMLLLEGGWLVVVEPWMCTIRRPVTTPIAEGAMTGSSGWTQTCCWYHFGPTGSDWSASARLPTWLFACSYCSQIV